MYPFTLTHFGAQHGAGMRRTGVLQDGVLDRSKADFDAAPEVWIGEIVGGPKAERKAHSQSRDGGFKRVGGPGNSPIQVSGNEP